MVKDMTQVKYTVEAGIVAAFRARCAFEGMSMTAVIRKWMIKRHTAKEATSSILTRMQRRKAVQEITGRLILSWIPKTNTAAGYLNNSHKEAWMLKIRVAG